MHQLCERKYCTGCTACASVCPKGCITMAADEDGFLCPVIDAEKCVSCGLCEKTCPIVTPPEKPANEPVAYAAYSRDEKLRLDSSSGGIFSELAKVVLNEGGAVFGAAYNEAFEVVHICVENETDLARLRGAKYAQSDLGGSYKDVKRRLEQGQKVLFSGTPCQVLGLKSFLHRNYDNLLLVDMICHSVPSPLAWKRYLEHISEGKRLATVNLRSKDTGWSRYGYSNRFDFSDGTCLMDRSGESLYMKLFGGGYITSTACTNCPAKGYARVSDLSIGDFWGIWDVAPEMDDNKGTSVVLVQSAHGAEILRKIGEMLVVKRVSLGDTSRENQATIRTASINPLRVEAMALIRNKNFNAAAKLIPPVTIPQKPSILRRGMSFLKRKIRGVSNS